MCFIPSQSIWQGIITISFCSGADSLSKAELARGAFHSPGQPAQHTPMPYCEANPGPLQDLEGLCREAGKQAADWAASIRSTAELADETGYELCSGRNRSLVAIKSEKRERTR